MSDSLRILIVRLSAIGDVIHSTPILHALRRKFPGAHIAWAVEDRASDVIVNNPLINRVYIFPKNKWKKRGLSFENFKEFYSIIKQIKKDKYDIAIDLQELFKSAFITYLSGAKRRIAHDKTREFAHLFVNEKLPAHDIFDPEKLIVERYLEPAAYLGAPTDEIKFSLPPAEKDVKEKIDNLLSGIEKEKPLAVFSPSTIWPSKHWREGYWREILEKLSSSCNIIFTGTQKDNELINRITTGVVFAKFLNLAGKTSLFELIEIFKRSDYVIGPDTGPLHIANATEKPKIIMIFGSTSYKRTPPVGEKHIAFSAELPCQPCFKRSCPRHNNKMECMKQITPDKILDAINN